MDILIQDLYKLITVDSEPRKDSGRWMLSLDLENALGESVSASESWDEKPTGDEIMEVNKQIGHWYHKKPTFLNGGFNLKSIAAVTVAQVLTDHIKACEKSRWAIIKQAENELETCRESHIDIGEG